MIYKINGYNTLPTYYVDQLTFDNNVNYELGTLIVGTQQDAQLKLEELQKTLLEYEAVRFSVCATFVNGADTTWREVKESDPEGTICQVFDHTNGSYTEVNNKTEAFLLNELRKNEFLMAIGLDKLYELSILPTFLNSSPIGDMPQPISNGTQTL